MHIYHLNTHRYCFGEKNKGTKFCRRVFVLLKENKLKSMFDKLASFRFFFINFHPYLKEHLRFTKLAAQHFSKVLNIYLHWPPPSWGEMYPFPSISIIYLWQILLLNQTENGKVVYHMVVTGREDLPILVTSFSLARDFCSTPILLFTREESLDHFSPLPFKNWI